MSFIMLFVNVVHNVFNVVHNCLKNVINCLNKGHGSQFSNIMNGILNDKKGHNIVNDIEQLCISQTVVSHVKCFIKNHLSEKKLKLQLNSVKVKSN